jgi:hypothetical protein
MQSGAKSWSKIRVTRFGELGLSLCTLGGFLITKEAQICGLLFPQFSYVLHYLLHYKTGWATFWAIFFTNRI